MPITVTATRDVTDAVVSVTVTGSGLIVNHVYALTINGQTIQSQKATGGTIQFTIQAATIPTAILLIFQSFCQTVTTINSIAAGYTNDSGTMTLTVS